MNQHVRVIKTQNEYDAAMARLSALMDMDFAPGSDEEAEIELLALVIESYEQSKVAPAVCDAIDAILFRMDQMNLSPKDLASLLGSASKVSEVLSRKRTLSLAMIRTLHKGLGIPAEVLIGSSDEDVIDFSSEPQYNYNKFPLQEMKERGCFPQFTGSIQKIKDHAEELVRGFLREISGSTTKTALLRAPLHQSGSREMDDYALIAWRACVLKKAQNFDHHTRYIKDSITDEWLAELVKLSRFETGPRLAQEYLADHGIVLVIEPHFKKTYLDGAAMLMGDTPIVALTLRHDRVDNFWFALLHELEHVRKHLTPEYAFIADNLDDKTRSSQEEIEADEGACNALILASVWDAAKVRTSHLQKDAIQLADQLRIHPAIVAGRVRYETNNWKLFNRLIKRGCPVSRHFESSTSI
jgi:HTH-type transcriptional regulator/antitoxin HigA